jgi:hypothetical protein
MSGRTKVLVVFLRVVGVSGLFALGAVVMPTSWMAAIHCWLGMDEMPTGPVVEYLARSLSAFYALLGGLMLVMASDIERYRPMVRFFAATMVLMSVAFTGIDWAAGMPWWWTALEGPPGLLLGPWTYYLARPDEQRAG